MAARFGRFPFPFSYPPRPSFKVSESLRKSIQDQTNVALDITKQLLLNEKVKDKNVVFSPLSIHVVLSMIAAGAKGSIQKGMLSFLKSKSIDALNTLASNVVPLVFADGSKLGGPLLSFANGVWLDQSLSIKPAFKNVLDNDFKAALKQVDFKTEPEEVRREVNSWGEKETKGLIKSILPFGSVSSATRVILANALYFKGEWDKEFDASYTRVRNFHLLDNAGSVKAHFMRTKRLYQYVSEFETFKVLKLPYKQGKDYEREFSMYIFLPNARNGLRALIEQFCSNVKFIDSHLPDHKVPVGRFLIPKFKISCGFEASKLLQTLGFSLGGLTEMVDPPEPLHVSLIFHKAFIEVNEKGTEAAAVTATGTMCSAREPVPPPPIDFVADHPFLYLIREEATKTVMFVGQVLNPIEDSTDFK
ncbi:hypothetical protein ACLB2K_024232 [Fragaria x ananassa]